jgi:transposase InsO family protein
MKPKINKQRGAYRMADDRWLVPMIRNLVDQRPTYGYRRIQVLLSRKLKALDKPGVNHRRVYRIMKQNHMLLSRYTGKRPMRAHNGMVITLRSNMRWCSDVFEIGCSNADVVRVAFSLDCCDRELISFVASTGGISSAMICDLLIQSVEHRFGSVERVPHSIEWLSDNGSCYTAKRRVTLPANWAWSAVPLQCRARKAKEWPKPSLKRLKGTMFTSITDRMRKRSSCI